MRHGSDLDMRHVSVDYPLPHQLFRKNRREGRLFPRRARRRHRALHDVTLRVSPGERVGLVGLNGAGKTTLFRVLAGILHPAEGTITISGHAAHSPTRHPVGYITAEPLVYRRITGYENLRFIARLYHLPDADDRIAAMAQAVGITPILHEYVEQYSSGMTARLDLARTLLPSPPLLLLDEPFSAFDIHAAEVARRMVERSRATVLLATHNLADIERLTRRLVLLHEGRLIRDVVFEDLSEVAPTEEGGKALSVAEFVALLLRQSLMTERPYPQPLHRKHVLHL